MPESFEELEHPASFSLFDIKPIPPRIQKLSFFGKVRSYNRITALEWIYLGASIVALTISLVITIVSLTEEELDDFNSTFAIVLLVTILFCYHYVVHSVFTECWDEIIIFVVSNIIVMLYCVFNYINNKDAEDEDQMKFVRLVFVGVFSPFLIVCGLHLCYRYFMSNESLYDIMGYSGSLQNACRRFLICISLLKFDLQLQISMLILIMSKGVTALKLYQQIILGSGIPVAVLFVFIGYLGLRSENIPLMIIFYILGVLENVYVIYMIVDTAQQNLVTDIIHETTFICGCFALSNSVLLFLSCLYYTKYDFGKGLKERMFGNQNTAPLPTMNTTNYDTFT